MKTILYKDGTVDPNCHDFWGWANKVIDGLNELLDKEYDPKELFFYIVNMLTYEIIFYNFRNKK